MNSFLQLLAKDLIQKYGHEFDNLTILFPNKRAGLFLAEELAHLITKPVWMPEILTLGEFIERKTGLKKAEELPLIIKLYKTYQEYSGTTERFDDFYFWGNMLLGDFDDIDKYLVDAKDLFSNITALKEIENAFPYLTPEQIEFIQSFWRSFNGEKYSREQQEFLNVWDKLYPTYKNFKAKLTGENLCYEGMGQRLFCERLSHYHTDKQLIFAGFNALNQCEKRIFSHFRDSGQASFYWDYDLYYSANENHEAGHYIRENMKLFPNALGLEHFNNFRYNNKEVEYISVPSTIGQAKLLPVLVEQLHPQPRKTYTDTAIVLCDETLLTPVIHSIPHSIDKINITMGYPAQNTSVAALIGMLGDLKRYAKQVDGATHYYYKPVIALLNHKLIKSSCPNDIPEITNYINTNNIVYVAEKSLQFSDITRTIFSSSTESLPDYLLNILKKMIAAFRPEEQEGLAIEKEFLFTVFTAIQGIQNTFREENIVPEDKFYLQVINKILQGISIPFSGEPLEGMQIMGLMETRMLDFKNLIILSANEGVLPKSGHASSFIPYNLRLGFGLPTPEHMDVLFAYYFYRLLQRAEHVKILYTDVTKGMTSGEMSRFLYQMKYESGLPIRETHFQNNISVQDNPVISISKNKAILEKLHRYTLPDERGISPSALNTYMECHLKFYFKYIAGIKEKEEIAEELDQRLLGTIFHQSTQSLYQTFPNGEITEEGLDSLMQNDTLIEEHIRQSYLQLYDSTVSRMLESGANELVLSVVKKYVKKVLEYDKTLCPFQLISMERKYRMSLEINTLEHPLVIHVEGDIDRVDRTDRGTRVIDYKTGADKTEFKDLPSIFDSNNRQRNKAAFQTLLYCMMYEHENPGTDPILPGIYSTKLLFTPNYTYSLKCNKEPIHRFKPYEPEFQALLTELLEQLFSPDVPFTQTELPEKCRHCSYNEICKRG
ncbi:PD-(D/E)XK nuclease family protein [Butyricimonas sp. Marseille-P3923]|uniref:PD-(D/E)XK nuclease family protein n=1 Tax=Butyricimonas sp. Marseille-P3923 TaxID=1987504 RepID=UPI000C0744A1|nr:PD-(D/E)XK nuclease family protein [Butyricimonas sp. Marseille-P3923]